MGLVLYMWMIGIVDMVSNIFNITSSYAILYYLKRPDMDISLVAT